MSSEYVTDVAYLRNFESDLGPSRLRLVAALNGFPVPPTEGFDYCEFGSAHGDTTVALAAANPGARFVGVDINPEHIASATKLAADGATPNVQFLERDFEDLAREDIGAFDFICAHGVLSWIGPAKRKAMLDFASARLKPGGLLYVSYNTMPGWAAVEPLRQLILSRAAIGEGNSLERARRGLDLAKQMNDAGAEYFASNPPAREMLATMERLGLPYVVHEYLHAHWVPMYFAQVAWEMASSDLYYVGGLPLYSNYRDVAIPPPLARLFKSVDDRVTFESLKDFAVNEYFRRDVYVKGKAGRSASATQAYFDDTPFGMLGLTSERDVRLPHHTLKFDGALFDALFDTLAYGASSVPMLAQHPALSSFGADKIRDGLLRMALGDRVIPMQRSETRKASAALAPPSAGALPQTPRGTLLGVPIAYNRMVLQQRPSGERPIVLASPAAGTGLPISTVQAVALRLLTEVPPEGRQAWIRSLFARERLKLKIGERAIADEQDQERIILEEVAELEQRRVPKFVELGILEYAR